MDRRKGNEKNELKCVMYMYQFPMRNGNMMYYKHKLLKRMI